MPSHGQVQIQIPTQTSTHSPEPQSLDPGKLSSPGSPQLTAQQLAPYASGIPPVDSEECGMSEDQGSGLVPLEIVYRGQWRLWGRRANSTRTKSATWRT